MKTKLYDILHNKQKLYSFFYEQTNFLGDKIEPYFYIIASKYNNKIGGWKDKIVIKGMGNSYISIVEGTGKLEKILNSFSDQSFEFNNLYNYLLEIEKEFNIEFEDIIID